MKSEVNLVLLLFWFVYTCFSYSPLLPLSGDARTEQWTPWYKRNVAHEFVYDLLGSSDWVLLFLDQVFVFTNYSFCWIIFLLLVEERIVCSERNHDFFSCHSLILHYWFSPSSVESMVDNESWIKLCSCSALSSLTIKSCRNTSNNQHQFSHVHMF